MMERSASPLSQRVREDEKLTPYRSTAQRSTRQHTAPRSVLYQKRVCELEQYRQDYKTHKYEHLTREQKLEIFGSTVVPIPVPLAVGETEEMYEERFVQWLTKQNLTLEELRASSDDHLERFYRIKFANLTSVGDEANARQSKKRSRSVDRSRSRSPRQNSRPRREDEDTGSKASKYSRRSRSRDRSPERGTHARELREKQYAPSGTRRCTFECPSDRTSVTQVVEAYVQCGCRPCLVSGMGTMVEKLAKLEDPSEEKEVRHKTSNQHVDLTGDSELTKPRSSRGAAEATTRLILSDSVLAKVQEEVASKLTGSEYLEIPEDVVENKLISEYDAINHRVEKESHHSEIGHRNAALAMAMVYLWRHDPSGLEDLTSDEGASDDSAQQRTLHKRCLTLSSDIAQTKAHVTKLKRRLDATMETTTFEQERDRIHVLAKLGSELATTEANLQAYRLQRRTAFAGITRTCDLLRGLIRTLLTSE